MFQKLIVVCTANICRSPMAEGLLNAGMKSGKCQIASAGTRALIGQKAAPYTREVMQAHGLDVSNHRAQQATEELLRSTDLVLAVDKSHLDWITSNFPYLRGRAHKLGKWRGDVDIPDPYGLPKEHFQSTYELIHACVNDWLPRLIK